MQRGERERRDEEKEGRGRKKKGEIGSVWMVEEKSSDRSMSDVKKCLQDTITAATEGERKKMNLPRRRERVHAAAR